jgi:hypothetical protein
MVLNLLEEYFEEHSGARLDIAEFEMAGSHAGIGVKELPHFVVVFGEFLGVDFGFILTFVVEHMNGFFIEILSDLGNFVDHIS